MSTCASDLSATKLSDARARAREDIAHWVEAIRAVAAAEKQYQRPIALPKELIAGTDRAAELVSQADEAVAGEIREQAVTARKQLLTLASAALTEANAEAQGMMEIAQAELRATNVTSEPQPALPPKPVLAGQRKAGAVGWLLGMLLTGIFMFFGVERLVANYVAFILLVVIPVSYLGSALAKRRALGIAVEKWDKECDAIMNVARAAARAASKRARAIAEIKFASAESTLRRIRAAQRVLQTEMGRLPSAPAAGSQ